MGVVLWLVEGGVRGLGMCLFIYLYFWFLYPPTNYGKMIFENFGVSQNFTINMKIFSSWPASIFQLHQTPTIREDIFSLNILCKKNAALIS